MKNKKHHRGSSQATILPMAIILMRPIGLGQYDSVGEYCDPYTASSVFLISLFKKIKELVETTSTNF